MADEVDQMIKFIYIEYTYMEHGYIGYIYIEYIYIVVGDKHNQGERGWMIKWTIIYLQNIFHRIHLH